MANSLVLRFSGRRVCPALATERYGSLSFTKVVPDPDFFTQTSPSSDRITRESDHTLDIVLTLTIDMRCDDHDISSHRITYVYRQVFHETIHAIVPEVTRGRVGEADTEVQIRELIDYDILFIVIACFHRASIDLEWRDKCKSQENDNKNNDHNITEKYNHFSHSLVPFGEIYSLECIGCGDGHGFWD
jgi:hypothetical protein